MLVERSPSLHAFASLFSTSRGDDGSGKKPTNRYLPEAYTVWIRVISYSLIIIIKI